VLGQAQPGAVIRLALLPVPGHSFPAFACPMQAASIVLGMAARRFAGGVTFAVIADPRGDSPTG